MIGHIDFGMAFSALALGLFYMVLARVLRGHASAGRTSLLMEICLALGVVFGTLATLLGCVLTWAFRNIRVKGLPVLSALAPVVCNTLIIGWEINTFFLDTPSFVGFVTSALGVGLGELAACVVLGLLLVALLERTGLSRLFREL